jgi:hypothetical protein
MQAGRYEAAVVRGCRRSAVGRDALPRVRGNISTTPVDVHTRTRGSASRRSFAYSLALPRIFALPPWNS